ncbi:MAG: hypothetical protein DSZ28_04345, partial [Thiothrix sp.]
TEHKKYKNLIEVIYSFSIGGSERLAATLAREFKGRGVNVSVCATHSAQGPISKELDKEGIPYRGFGFETRSRLGKWLFPIQLYLYFKQQRAEVIHVQHVFVLQRCYWPARLAGVKRLVLTEHSDYAFRTMPDYKQTSRKYGKRADKVTAIHKQLQQYLVDELDIPFAKTQIIYNSVDTEHFSPGIPQLNLRKQLGLEDGCVLLGWVGRMHAAKDLANLINAYERVSEKAHLCHALVLVGDGDDRALAENLVRTKGLSERVFFLGERQDVPDLMRNFSIYVSSSKTEGVPLVILEAMSTGLPCVATEVGGIAEVVKKGTGWLVPPKDPQALANSVIQLIENSVFRSQASIQARDYVTSNFQFESMVDAYEEALRIA